MSTDGASSSRSSQVLERQLITQVNESLFELYRPKGTPSVQILFFHGLQLDDYSNAHVSTWTSADGSCVWPRTWLVEQFPDAHVLTVLYSSATKKCTQVTLDMFNVGENLVSDFMSDDVGQTPSCPVILVGHSLGGLVIKQVCCQAYNMLNRSEGTQKDKLNAFLNNVRGVFFYATPHHGSQYATALENNVNNPLLTFLKTLSTDTARLNHEFDTIQKLYDKKWRLAGLGESLPTRLPTRWPGLSKGVWIAPEGSARACGDFQVMEGTDHFSICQPKDRISRNFSKLRQFVKDIINDVEDEARHPQNYQHLPESTVGIDVLLQETVGKLGNAKTLGLFGMGGLGKSTLAKAIFNKMGSSFEYTCFVPDVKETEGDVNSLEEEVRKQMHFHGKKVGENFGTHQLREKRLLLVLDDISTDRDVQVSSILLDGTSPESRCIVTSREGELKNRFEVTYDVPLLNEAPARQLFLNCALSTDNEPVQLEEFVGPIVGKCDGLPLALEVIGKYLSSRKDAKDWEATLRALMDAEAVSGIDDKLSAKLRISYDGLEGKEQQIFLDATAFFIDTEWTLHQAKAAWRVIYDTESVDLFWDTLVRLSLVYNVKGDENIRVHDQLRSLGQKIASGPPNWRVWTGKAGEKLLRTPNELEEKEVLALKVGSTASSDEIHLPSSVLRGLGKLRYLELHEFPQIVVNPAPRWSHRGWNLSIIPTKLVLLQCQASRFSQSLLRHPILQDYLVGLKLNGPCQFDSTRSSNGLMLKRLLGPRQSGSSMHCNESLMLSMLENIGNLSKLKFFGLCACDCVRRLPQTFGHCLSNLTHFTLSKSANVRTVPESFGQLKTLTHLRFRFCAELQALPESFGQLKALSELEFYRCYKLQVLPESFGQLKALRTLKVSSCGGLQALPQSFGQLKALSTLEVSSCGGLQALPESFGQLKALSTLRFWGCGGLQALPESFGQLKALGKLVFSGCKRLRALPESFGQLKALSTLEVRYCNTLQALPKSFGQLEALSKLVFGHCNKLQVLSESFGLLKALSMLEVDYCDGIQALPESFGQLKALSWLRFGWCKGLQALSESFGQLEALSTLKFWDCGGLQALPESFGQLKALSMLEFVKCNGLQALPESFGQLEVLSTLKLDCCSELQVLPKSFGQLQALRKLEFVTCQKLQALPESFGHLKTLSTLEFVECNGLQALPESFGQLKALSTLTFDVCDGLQALPESFGQLKTLSILTVVGCDGLQALPESFGQLQALSKLEFLSCQKLQALPESFGQLKALSTLKFGQCEGLLALPKSFGQLEALSTLRFWDCGGLQALPKSFKQLKALSMLEFDRCNGLQALPESDS